MCGGVENVLGDNMDRLLGQLVLVLLLVLLLVVGLLMLLLLLVMVFQTEIAAAVTAAVAVLQLHRLFPIEVRLVVIYCG